MEIRAIYKEIGKPHEVRSVDMDKLTTITFEVLPESLEDMTLSGYDSPTSPYGMNGTLMLPHTRRVVAGGFVVTGVDENGERCSLTEEQIGRAKQFMSDKEIDEKMELGEAYGLMYDMLSFFWQDEKKEESEM